MSEIRDELDDLLRELGVVQGEFLPDDQAPAVDRERLQALLRRELPPDEAVHVAELTVLFRSWHEAWEEALRESFRNWRTSAEQGALASESSFQLGSMAEVNSGDSNTAAGHRGGALRAARESIGWDLQRLFKEVVRLRPRLRTHLSIAVLEAIEAGKRRLDIVLATPLAQALKVPLERILAAETSGPDVVFLRHSGDGGDTRPVPPESGGVKDIEQELRDFLSADVARAMVAAWKGQPGDLDGWLDQYAAESESDPFDRTLVRTLACISLKKSHGEAAGLVDQLVELAGEDPRRLVVALYLHGRQRWYVNEVDPAIASLRRACDLARDFNDVREAQCLIYLARLAIDYPDRSPERPEPLLREALRLAETLKRRDIEILAKRAEISRLQKERQIDAAMDLARSLLEETERYEHLGSEAEHILQSVRVELGMALRKTYTEEARQEAELIYQEEIERGRADSHAGMCHYLMADLEVDRMLDAQRHAVQLRGSDCSTEATGYLEQAKAHHFRALALCEQSQRMLAPTQDLAAQQKVNRRLVFLRNLDLELPLSSQIAADEFALRIQYGSHLFLGAPLVTGSGPYSPAVPELTRDQLERLLGEFFAGMYLQPRSGPPSPPVPVCLDDYLRPGSVLGVPWIVGNSLVVRVFGLAEATGRIKNLGWFAVDGYATDLQPVFRHFLELPDDAFASVRGECFAAIQERVQTIDPLPMPAGSSPFGHVVLLAPRSNPDWICPVEWLQTMDPRRRQPTPPLAELAGSGLMYATSRRSPYGAVGITVPPDRCRIYASTQGLSGGTVHGMAVKHFGERVARFDVAEAGEPIGERAEGEGVLILAHSDRQGRLAAQLERWEFPNARVVVLLFCSSGHYQLASGPFVDGVALKVREKLGDGAAVVGSRVPVEPDEAVRLAGELLDEANRGTPVVTMVTRYLQLYGKGKPFEVPWVVLA